MIRPKKRHSPIVLTGRTPRDKSRQQAPVPTVEPAELEGPLPGPILVQLSRLHRAKPSRPSGSGN